MDLPHSLPEAWTWISSLTPESWANFRLGRADRGCGPDPALEEGVMLISAENDDAEILRAEDEAIEAARKPPTEPVSIPTGLALAQLIQEALDGTPVQREGQG